MRGGVCEISRFHKRVKQMLPALGIACCSNIDKKIYEGILTSLNMGLREQKCNNENMFTMRNVLKMKYIEPESISEVNNFCMLLWVYSTVPKATVLYIIYNIYRRNTNLKSS